MARDRPAVKPVHWMGGSLRDLRNFPDGVREEAGHGLYLAQCGASHESEKPLRGFGGAGVRELVLRDEAGAFRVVFTVRFARAVYVLHAFQKKSKRGTATPAEDLELIEKRLTAAGKDYETRYPEAGETPDDAAEA